MTRIAIYTRVSTDAQAERYGLAAQEWALKQRVQERGHSLVLDGDRDVFVDEGYSGGDLERPTILRLRQAVHEGRVDIVLCYDPDWLSRSLSDLLLLTDEVERAGVRLDFITQPADALLAQDGRFWLQIRSVDEMANA